MKNLRIKYILIIFIGLALNIAMSGASFGQSDKEISLNARVMDSSTLMAGKTKISLWGIEKIEDDSAIFHLKIRQALENTIADKKILCAIKSKISTNYVKAQCVNGNEEDLSLFLLNQGYASADRNEIYRTIYEAPYLNAEENAQINGNGIWGNDKHIANSQGKNFLTGVFLLIIIFILSIGAISFYIMRGFSRVVDLQNQTADLAVKERIIKEKEKYIIAAILDAEIRSNKAKIEAYIIIYEEILLGFSESERALEYQKTGDIVQKQPALNRSVFDGNTNKLDLLGPRLASSIIHYYARIKTTPEYTEIKPDLSQSDAKKIIENVISNAKKLDKISDKLTESFIQHALIKNLE